MHRIFFNELLIFLFHVSDKVILNNALDVEKGSSNITSALKYFNSISEYMLQLRQVLEELRDDIEGVAQEELNNADQEKIIGIAVLSCISLVTLVFYIFVKNALSVIRVKPHDYKLLCVFRQTSHHFSPTDICQGSD